MANETAEEKLETLAKGMEAVQKLASMMLALVLGYVLVLPFQGYVFGIGWNWFMAPVFGVSLTFWQAFGIWALLRFAAHSSSKRDDSISLLGQVGMALVYTLLVYGTFAVIEYFGR